MRAFGCADVHLLCSAVYTPAVLIAHSKAFVLDVYCHILHSADIFCTHFVTAFKRDFLPEVVP